MQNQNSKRDHRQRDPCLVAFHHVWSEAVHAQVCEVDGAVVGQGARVPEKALE